jgi:hypothetical protein
VEDVTGHHSSWWDERWTDAFQLRSGAEVLITMREREPVAGIEGIAYRLQRLTLPRRDIVHECVFGVPRAGVEELVVSPSERFALAFLNSGDGECGYELFAIDGEIRRLGIGQPFTLPIMLSPPAFSPDERMVVSATGSGSPVWWAAGDEGDRGRDRRASGGPVTFGFVVVHDLDRNRPTRHKLEFDLPAGWCPADPEDGRWRAPEGVEFVHPTRIEIGLPDGSDVELELPLPDVVVLPTPDADA